MCAISSLGQLVIVSNARLIMAGLAIHFIIITSNQQ